MVRMRRDPARIVADVGTDARAGKGVGAVDRAIRRTMLRRPERKDPMARIPLLDPADPALSDTARTALAEAGAARGRVLNIHRAMANRPEALAAFTRMITTVYRQASTLSPRHGELAYLTATAVNDCYY